MAIPAISFCMSGSSCRLRQLLRRDATPPSNEHHVSPDCSPSVQVGAMKFSKLITQFRIDKPDKFRLSDHDPGNTCGLDIEKDDAKEMLAAGIKRLAELQERLYANDCWSVLAVFQAMDAAGKDGAIEHVMSGVNPQGCQVHAFKAPSAEELDHDFLWRCATRLPERGRIGIFNRSYYEEVLVVKVHPTILAGQHLPGELLGKKIWQQRYEDINAYERYLA